MKENNKKYIYSEGDLLKNPINYQRVPFEGVKFLKEYFKSREKIISNDDNNEFNQIIEKFPKIELENNECIETNQLLQYLSQQIIHKTFDSKFKNNYQKIQDKSYLLKTEFW